MGSPFLIRRHKRVMADLPLRNDVLCMKDNELTNRGDTEFYTPYCVSVSLESKSNSFQSHRHFSIPFSNFYLLIIFIYFFLFTCFVIYIYLFFLIFVCFYFLIFLIFFFDSVITRERRQRRCCWCGEGEGRYG